MGDAVRRAEAAAAAARAAEASDERLGSLQEELDEARQAQLTCQETAEAEAASKRQVRHAPHQSKANHLTPHHPSHAPQQSLTLTRSLTPHRPRQVLHALQQSKVALAKQRKQAEHGPNPHPNPNP